MASGREGGRVHLASKAGLADGVRLFLALQQVLEIDPSAHSGQGHSLDVCRNLLAWFQQEGERTLTFVQVPSIKEWGIHKEAHDFAGGLPPISVGRHLQNSLDRVRQDITSKCLDSWIKGSQCDSTQP